VWLKDFCTVYFISYKYILYHSGGFPCCIALNKKDTISYLYLNKFHVERRAVATCNDRYTYASIQPEIEESNGHTTESNGFKLMTKTA